MLVQQDGAGNRIAYTFNVRNLETSRQDIGSVEEPALNTPKEVYIYTADGKLLQKTDRNGIPTNYTYDGLGRLVSEKAGNEEKQYGYDAAGNLLFMRNGADITRRTYDAEGRVVSKTVDGIGTVTYQYDIPMGAGAVKEITTAPDGSVTETVYDAVGRVSQVSGSRGETVHYVYNANGSCQATVYEDGTREDYVYDASGNVLTVKHTDRYGTLLDAYEYEYDIAGNLTKETSQYGTTTYVYDADCRLQSVTEPEGKITTYSYDMAGNRVRKEVSNPGSVPIVTEYTYNVSNQLMKQHTSDGTVTEYTYDANGNLIYEETVLPEEQKEEDTGLANSTQTVSGSAIMTPATVVSGSAITTPVTVVSGSAVEVPTEVVRGSVITIPTKAVTGSAIRYTYDTFNRLTEYSSGDIWVEYSYNAEDYRVGKRVVDTNGVEVIQYFYEGDRVLFETDGTGSITAYNLYGSHLISRSVQGEQYYYLYNAHGDVVMLMDTATGAVAATYRYDAFGNLLQQTGDADNNITYAGYQYDEETGLYYLNARYYNSNTGRFLTEDTYRGRQQDPLSLHRYTYCHYNPIRYVDPSGHTWMPSNKQERMGKAFFNAAKDLVEGAATLVKDVACLTYYSAGVGAGKVLHLTGVMDDQTWGYYKDIAYDDLEPYYEKFSLFKPIGDTVSYGAGYIYMKATGEDQQTIDNFHEIAQEQIAADGRESGKMLLEGGKSLLNPLNPKSMYNFFLNPYTSQEEMDKYASDLLSLGLTVGVPTAKACSGLKLSKGSLGISKSSMIFSPDGTVTIAKTTTAIPTLVLEGELATVPSTYYAIAAGSFVDACYGDGTGSGGYQSGSKTSEQWYKSTFDTVEDSMEYHLDKHGKGRGIEEYTQDAMEFYNQNKHLGEEVILKDGTEAIKIQTGTGKNKVGGYWTKDGKLVTFWD